nr:hypothetical protein [uncultured Fluviicola sp.]
MGNPLRLIGPTGKGPTDWFYNPQTGNVIYIKGQSTVKQEDLDKIESPYKPSDYLRLGDDNMFGSTVSNGATSNVLDKDIHLIENPAEFMYDHGYHRAQMVSVIEKESTQGGSFGAGENIKHTQYSMDQSKTEPSFRYAKESEMDVRMNQTQKIDYYTFSHVMTIKYDYLKPYGGTVTNGAFNQDIGTVLDLFGLEEETRDFLEKMIKAYATVENKK